MGCSPWHRQFVEDYRAARLADEERRDVEVGGTVEEWAAFTRDMITFRRWLTSSRGNRYEESYR
ncbi:MAG: hypothetical protein A2Y78_10205 [Acidobacteria bacterium RBG_13_68_16]|nr:MAG: hypothetical protein A2Y78_10205 [Acidobacteria bacterium RBG_13_68_16]